MTRFRVSALTRSGSAKARETVAGETFALRATSRMEVGETPFRWLMRHRM
jgi:hypothetical protein